MKYTTDQKLKILANWLQDSDTGIDSYADGTLEQAIKVAKQEVKQEIGDYLEEILNGNDEFIRYQLNSIEANEQLKKDNLQVFHKKELIIKFYLNNFIINPIHYIKIYLILFFYSKFFTFIKHSFKTKRKIITKNNKIYFLSQKRKWYHKVIDQLRLNNNYQEIEINDLTESPKRVEKLVKIYKQRNKKIDNRVDGREQ